jgi:serine protease Do
MCRFAITLISSIIFCAYGHSLFAAQADSDVELWSWTASAAHHEAIVQVSLDGAVGTGVVIHVDKEKPLPGGFEGYCLTAHHVVADDEGRRSIRVTYRNGRTAKKCRVVESDQDRDVALIWVWVPEAIRPAKLAQGISVGGDNLEFTGLGGGVDLRCCLRHFSAVASLPTNSDETFADVPLLPGDSGGPVFNANREVVGVISGGWFWWDGGVKAENGSAIRATWPAQASNTEAILRGTRALAVAGRR